MKLNKLIKKLEEIKTVYNDMDVAFTSMVRVDGYKTEYIFEKFTKIGSMQPVKSFKKTILEIIIKE